MRLATHSQRLETWLGKDEIDNLVNSMKDWYGPPIPVGNVPGDVWISKGGDFRGHIAAGAEAGLMDKVHDIAYMLDKESKRRWRRFMKKQLEANQLNSFSSLSDLIAEMTASGKRQERTISKTGTTGVAGCTNSLWFSGNYPGAGAAVANAPGGTIYNSASQGALSFNAPAGGDTLHFIAGNILSTVGPNTLLMYDRLMSANKTMSSTTAESLTGVPTRYQASSGDESCQGNFMFVECTTALGATAHNWSVIQYIDQDDVNTSSPGTTGNASNIINRLDMPIGQWFIPLAVDDTGIKRISSMQCTASVTGGIAFTLGHPLGWIPCPLANLLVPADGIASALQLTRLIDNHAIGFLEVNKGATTATTYNGTITTCSG